MRRILTVNPELVDEALDREITALTDVMLAATDASGPLSQDAIDHALGIPPEPDGPTVLKVYAAAETKAE